MKRQRSSSPTSSAPHAQSEPHVIKDDLDVDAYTAPLAQGRHSSTPPKPQRSSVPTWNAAALLDPKNFAVTTAMPPTTSTRQPTTGTMGPSVPVNHTNPLTFQFASPDDNNIKMSTQVSSDQGPTHTNGAGQPPVTNGMGAMLDRKYNLQDRSTIPEPKRRKIETTDEAGQAKQAFRGNGTHILGDYIKEKRSEGTATPPLKRAETVDLTDGKSAVPICARCILIVWYGGLMMINLSTYCN